MTIDAPAEGDRRRDRQARLDQRAWRAKVRAADIAPLPTKVRHKGGLVDVVPMPKKRGAGK